jgi:hypothetical protein
MYALQQHQLLYLYPELVCPSQLKDPLIESYVCPTAAQLNDPLIESYVCPTAAPVIISLPGVGLPLTTKRSPGRELCMPYSSTAKRSPDRELCMPYSSTSYYIFTRSCTCMKNIYYRKCYGICLMRVVVLLNVLVHFLILIYIDFLICLKYQILYLNYSQ